MADFTLAAFGAIAAALFVTELTDKDAFLLITVSTRVRAMVAFLAGVTAFVLTTALFVSVGSLLLVIVPVLWVRLVGGAIMVGYGLWQVKGIIGLGSVEREESKIEKIRSPWRTFLALVASLAVLDIAGDATEVLTIVFVARYSNPLLVFTGTITGLIAATGLETALGSRLGRVLTPGRLRIVSAAVFLILGGYILLSSSG
ncbi:MAG: TMEM165/GDT1 family protein [Thaumarchaeota archaeon]|nr:TMEM165/GDT1 family protein [Nitrososphaerota archaeon]